MPTLLKIRNSKFAFSKQNFSIRNSLLHKGFTLIELLVVIAIIGILATFIVASFTSAQQRGRDARRKSDLDALKKALELAKQDTLGGSRYQEGITSTDLVTPGYIKAIPVDPRNVAPYVYAYNPIGAGGSCATPCTDPTGVGPFCTDFRIVARLENESDPQATDGPANSSTITNCPAVSGCTSYSTSTNDYVVCAP